MFAARGGFFSNQGIIVTGGTLTTDGSYSIRTFIPGDTTLGILNGNLTFDYLVVGKGGQGGTYVSGSQDAKGGGGGGEVLTGNVTYASGSYTVFVSSFGGNGNSILNSITALPGESVTGNTTDSGDGGDSGNGNIGGNRDGTSAAGGGAGNSSNGSFAPDSLTGGNGGNGTNSSITGTTIMYGSGGGGAGSTGGIGGSGAGNGAQSGQAATNGVDGRGGGGGGGIDAIPTGGNGGLGTVIIRYLTAGTQ